jgi:hypothetical protein
MRSPCFLKTRLSLIRPCMSPCRFILECPKSISTDSSMSLRTRRYLDTGICSWKVMGARKNKEMGTEGLSITVTLTAFVARTRGIQRNGKCIMSSQRSSVNIPDRCAYMRAFKLEGGTFAHDRLETFKCRTLRRRPRDGEQKACGQPALGHSHALTLGCGAVETPLVPRKTSKGTYRGGFACTSGLCMGPDFVSMLRDSGKSGKYGRIYINFTLGTDFLKGMK